jgi:hypothetical protein
VNWYDAANEYDRRTNAHDGQLSSLPHEWQRELVALARAEHDINNGAYLQFLANGGRESYVYASQALRKIGAHTMADILDNCQALVDEHFPSEGKSQDELVLLLTSKIIRSDGRVVKEETDSVLPEGVRRRVLDLSYEYMGYPDDVGPLAQSYYGPLIEADGGG